MLGENKTSGYFAQIKLLIHWFHFKAFVNCCFSPFAIRCVCVWVQAYDTAGMKILTHEGNERTSAAAVVECNQGKQETYGVDVASTRSFATGNICQWEDERRAAWQEAGRTDLFLILLFCCCCCLSGLIWQVRQSKWWRGNIRSIHLTLVRCAFELYVEVLLWFFFAVNCFFFQSSVA